MEATGFLLCRQDADLIPTMPMPSGNAVIVEFWVVTLNKWLKQAAIAQNYKLCYQLGKVQIINIV